MDLGSNSFHMVVARREHGQLTLLDRMREMVRLGAGLDADDRLSDEAAARAIACLQRFSQRLEAMHAGSVRAVGTNTLRRAANRDDFLARAEAALGHSIEVISGVEEARLIYMGAAHSLPRDPGERLVLDIGGGSTEVVIGRDDRPRRLESLYIGCVGLSADHFPEGRVSAARFRAARIAARQELAPLADRFRGGGWARAVGTSGTIRATSKLVRDEDNPSGIITRQGLADLERRIVACGRLTRRRPPGLSEHRAPVYPGGLAILAEAFEVLSIRSMVVADGALREGLLYDLLGRLTHEDARERSVRAMQARFHADTEQAARVADTALEWLDQVAPAWELAGETPRRLLGWAARLHEVGLDIAHAQHHLHAAYLLEHADMAGFSSGEQLVLAALVGNHRRRLRLELLQRVSPAWRARCLRMAVLLRLAVLLHRSRSPVPLPAISLEASAKTLRVRLPRGWLEAHPLTAADLEQEAGHLKSAGVLLRLAHPTQGR